MTSQQHLKVAILLATRNGERYIEQQIRSLKQNTSAFTLHWLDDQSSDNTREVVKSVSERARITLIEWHQPKPQGYPNAFFTLLECVEADIYLFCDQDDIWQPGKIDATVTHLLPDLRSPAICFSDPLAFKDDQPGRNYPMLKILGAKTEVALQESRVFMSSVGFGHTQGFTRPLRDIYMRHKDIARAYAFGHDGWMYAIAVASGTARLMTDAPTTLYRWHASNFSGNYGNWRESGSGRYVMKFRQIQRFRQALSRQAQGFILASPTLPQTPRLETLLQIARLVARIHGRQSPAALIKLARRGALWASTRLAVNLAFACLCTDATT